MYSRPVRKKRWGGIDVYGIEGYTVFIGLLCRAVIAGEGRAKEYADRRTIRLHGEDKKAFTPRKGREPNSPAVAGSNNRPKAGDDCPLLWHITEKRYGPRP
jgi:hypothetical protein